MEPPQKIVDNLLEAESLKDFARQVEIKRPYRYYAYDVWGNAEEGYEVNNVFKTNDVIRIPESALHNDEVFFSYLVKVGFLTLNKGTISDYSTDGDEEIIYMNRDEDSHPEGEFRLETEERGSYDHIYDEG